MSYLSILWGHVFVSLVFGIRNNAERMAQDSCWNILALGKSEKEKFRKLYFLQFYSFRGGERHLHVRKLTNMLAVLVSVPWNWSSHSPSLLTDASTITMNSCKYVPVPGTLWAPHLALLCGRQYLLFLKRLTGLRLFSYLLSHCHPNLQPRHWVWTIYFEFQFMLFPAGDSPVARN